MNVCEFIEFVYKHNNVCENYIGSVYVGGDSSVLLQSVVMP